MSNLRTSGLSTVKSDARVNEVRRVRISPGEACLQPTVNTREMSPPAAREGSDAWGRESSSLWFGVGGALSKPAGTTF